MSIQQFRHAVYHTMPKRADATFDLVDALTTTSHVQSPVALSEAPLFRREFSSVYDALTNGRLDQDQLAHVLYEHQPGACETIAGYEVYAVDTTPEERPDAETLPERGLLKSDQHEPTRIGLKFSWLVRLVQRQTSWVAPQDVRRVTPNTTETRSAAEQVQTLDQHGDRPKVVVADSRYSSHIFLAVFLLVRTVVALVRLRHNQNLYERPQPKPAGSKGAPRKHGPVFKVANPSRPADRTETFQLGRHTVRLAAWEGLHLRKLPGLVGLALRVEFLKADGTPRYKRPLWLFWTGSTALALQQVCQMYLWRFAIEHAFRFLKQHLGLTASRTTRLICADRWMWLCALAYWQLLLMREEVEDLRPAWHRRAPVSQPRPLTPGQVQRGALGFLLKLGTPAEVAKPAGKGQGRAKGYRPQPRQRFAVVRKSPKRRKSVHTRHPAGV
jgi:hypothetical protein